MKKSGWDNLATLGGIAFVVMQIHSCYAPAPKRTSSVRVAPGPMRKPSGPAGIVPTTTIANRSDMPTPAAHNVNVADTKTAWDRLAIIDLQVRSYQNDPVRYWEHNYLQYAQVNIDYVDPELRSLVQHWIRVSVDTHDLLAKYLQERARIGQAAINAAQFGAAVGSTNQENPAGGAAVGQLLFGLFGAAAADEELKKLNALYEPPYQTLTTQAQEIIRRRDKVGESLTQRYGLPFRRKL